jgi:hypothetical protein
VSTLTPMILPVAADGAGGGWIDEFDHFVAIPVVLWDCIVEETGGRHPGHVLLRPVTRMAAAGLSRQATAELLKLDVDIVSAILDDPGAPDARTDASSTLKASANLLTRTRWIVLVQDLTTGTLLGAADAVSSAVVHSPSTWSREELSPKHGVYRLSETRVTTRTPTSDQVLKISPGAIVTKFRAGPVHGRPHVLETSQRADLLVAVEGCDAERVVGLSPFSSYPMESEPISKLLTTAGTARRWREALPQIEPDEQNAWWDALAEASVPRELADLNRAIRAVRLRGDGARGRLVESAIQMCRALLIAVTEVNADDEGVQRVEWFIEQCMNAPITADAYLREVTSALLLPYEDLPSPTAISGAASGLNTGVAAVVLITVVDSSRYRWWISDLDRTCSIWDAARRLDTALLGPPSLALADLIDATGALLSACVNMPTSRIGERNHG